jgi:hypothetical protein
MSDQNTISISGIKTTNFPRFQPSPIPYRNFLFFEGDNKSNLLDFILTMKTSMVLMLVI